MGPRGVTSRWLMEPERLPGVVDYTLSNNVASSYRWLMKYM